MTGAMINLTVDNKAITQALKALAEKDGGLMRASLKNIGEVVVRQTQARFIAQKAPDGQPWTKLNPDYATGKRGPGILRESGQLMGSIVWQLSGDDTLKVGTNKIYGAIHQLGGKIVPRTANALVFRLGGKLIFAKSVTIPARPYLGLSASDVEAILDVIADHAEEIWEEH